VESEALPIINKKSIEDLSIDIKEEEERKPLKVSSE
jgi:hypothetical protein